MDTACPHRLCRGMGAGKPIATAKVTVDVKDGGEEGGDEAFMGLAALLAHTCTRVGLSVYSDERDDALAALARAMAVAGGLASCLECLEVVPRDAVGEGTASMGLWRLAVHPFPVLTRVRLWNAMPEDVGELAGLQVGAAGKRGGRSMGGWVIIGQAGWAGQLCGEGKAAGGRVGRCGG